MKVCDCCSAERPCVVLIEVPNAAGCDTYACHRCRYVEDVDCEECLEAAAEPIHG